MKMKMNFASKTGKEYLYSYIYPSLMSSFETIIYLIKINFCSLLVPKRFIKFLKIIKSQFL